VKLRADAAVDAASLEALISTAYLDIKARLALSSNNRRRGP